MKKMDFIFSFFEFDYEIKRFFNNHLIDSLSTIKNFVDINSINYIKIPNIDISKFTIPTFNFSGKFELGSTAYRDEYVKYVQCSLKGITNPCLYMFELLSPNLEEVFKTYKAFSDE